MQIKEKINQLFNSIETVFVGKKEVVELALNALFSGGHLLINDLPGVGKTTLAKAIAGSIGGDSKRIQFTPDLLPTDISGVNVYIHQTNCFNFHPGPIFTNILLADEINRATPRAQSSLLEAMEETQVSVDGKTYKLQQPFMVIATQNPVEIQGTFPLPEAQLDRFIISLAIGYPTREEESRILEDRAVSDPLDSISVVMELAEVMEIRKAVKAIRIDESVKQYILDITEASRKRDEILIGASPRASIALMNTSRAQALFQGRDFVTPDDVKSLAPSTLAHRLILRQSTRLNIERNAETVKDILNQVPVPRPR